MNRRITLLISLGALILTSAIFFIIAPDNARNEYRSSSKKNPVSTKAQDDSYAQNSGRENRKRQVPDAKQIAARVDSLLDLPEGEAGLISIPAEELPFLLESLNPQWVPDQAPLKSAEVPVDAIRSPLAAILQRGNQLGAKVGDEGIIEWNGGDHHLTLMRSSDEQPDQAELQLKFSDNSISVSKSASIEEGNILLILAPEPAKKAWVISIGKGSPPLEEVPAGR